MPDWRTPFEEITIGKGRKIKDGQDIAILSFGHPGNFATAAIRDLRAEGIDPAHYDMRFVKPLDEEFYTKYSPSTTKSLLLKMVQLLVVLEPRSLNLWSAHNYKAAVKILGIPDRIVEHGTPKQLHEECGFDANSIAEAVRQMVKEKVNVNICFNNCNSKLRSKNSRSSFVKTFIVFLSGNSVSLVQ